MDCKTHLSLATCHCAFDFPRTNHNADVTKAESSAKKMPNQSRMTRYGQPERPSLMKACHTIGIRQPASATKVFHPRDRWVPDSGLHSARSPRPALMAARMAGPRGLASKLGILSSSS